MLNAVSASIAVLLAIGASPATPRPSPSPSPPPSAVDSAMHDLRTVLTALEAYSIDNDGLYAAPGARLEGTTADLDALLAPTYIANVPHVDPWGHPYRFLVSGSRRGYALYCLGPSGQLDSAARTFLDRLRTDTVSEGALTVQQPSQNLVFASGMLVFAPPAVLQSIKRASSERSPLISERVDTDTHRSQHDIEVLAVAIEAHLAHHDTLPKEAWGTRVSASVLASTLTPPSGYALAFTDPWGRPYEIAVSPSGRRAAVYSRGKENSLSSENDSLINQTLRGTLTNTATTYAVNLVITSLISRAD